MAGPRPTITHKISSLSSTPVSTRTTIGGWLVSRRQANPTLAFFNLKDTSGTVQLVVNAKEHPEGVEQGKIVLEGLMGLPLHSVLQVGGMIKERQAGKGDKQVSLEGSISRVSGVGTFCGGYRS